jgi:hypothetical protein
VDAEHRFILSPCRPQEGLVALFAEHGPVVKVKFLPAKVPRPSCPVRAMRPADCALPGA